MWHDKLLVCEINVEAADKEFTFYRIASIPGRPRWYRYSGNSMQFGSRYAIFNDYEMITINFMNLSKEYESLECELVRKTREFSSLDKVLYNALKEPKKVSNAFPGASKYFQWSFRSFRRFLKDFFFRLTKSFLQLKWK